MSEEHYSTILNEVRNVKAELVEKLEHLEERIKAEMNLKHQAIDFKHQDHERRLSFTEKILFTTAGFILLAVLGSLITLTLK